MNVTDAFQWTWSEAEQSGLAIFRLGGRAITVRMENFAAAYELSQAIRNEVTDTARRARLDAYRRIRCVMDREEYAD